ncbi:hypothetical protein H261_09702 [Paramagnetospirillum caucaseum]|uniref:Uncharacterized protein n=1 Tax=Paramagnetospirillum caucaseum TaxID=1244869 RepID=M3ACG1_9PROT|nr:hypothetical protein H261_09702 [Paramagnetospirillum caucaseum]
MGGLLRGLGPAAPTAGGGETGATLFATLGFEDFKVCGQVICSFSTRIDRLLPFLVAHMATNIFAIGGAELAFIDRAGSALEPLAQGVVKANWAGEAERLRNGSGGVMPALLRPGDAKRQPNDRVGRVKDGH